MKLGRSGGRLEGVAKADFLHALGVALLGSAQLLQHAGRNASAINAVMASAQNVDMEVCFSLCF